MSVCAGGCGCGLGTAGAKGHKDFCFINVCSVPAGHDLNAAVGTSDSMHIF